MDPQTRRHILSLGGVLASASLAGCVGNTAQGGKENADGEEESHEDHDHDDEHGNDEDSHSHDSDHELGHPEDHVEVEMVAEDGYHFMPHLVHIEKGGTVEWIVDSGAHNTVAYHPETHSDQQRIPADGDPWESDHLSETGDTFARTFDVEGVYDYACTPHENHGMVGSIVVGWPDPENQLGLKPPSETLPEAVYEQFERYNEHAHDVLEDGKQDH